MKRYEELVLVASNGIKFEVSEKTNGALIIRATPCSNNALSKPPTVLAGEYATELSVYTDKDGNNAVVPPGWTVSGAKNENTIWGKNEGLVIYCIPKKRARTMHWSNEIELEDLQKKYDQLTWVPVEKLDSNGTLDGVKFNEKFGRRDYQNNEFSESKFYEPLEGELALQFESVKKYGGFYISRYNISENWETGKTQSVKGEKPWITTDFNKAREVAATLVGSDTIKSHLPYGAEYDSVLEWFIKSKSRNLSEIAEDSTNWGCHWNTKSTHKGHVVKTGSCESWCNNNICDFAGNVSELTQEKYEDKDFSDQYVIRGGNCNYDGSYYPVAYRVAGIPFYSYECIGFRATIYIK